MINLVLPFIMQLGFATITLDDGHRINSPFIRSGEVSKYSGFVINTGDMSDIQTALNGNSCLIRVSEIKHNFEKEVKQVRSRCKRELKVLSDALDDSKLLNQRLKKDLKEERDYSKNLLIVSVGVGAVLTASTVWLSIR